ncbi:46033_t:CDS:1 [Gigaspora margarita]|uniref:46033_t:CDS:1 n=1 Tax=Gigaspora margarita TaxID=4874 RepID=A0ABN7VWE7_GIGMA|nr:46033_t:CDS:1 [Gigaspora margarita]
MEYCDFIKIGKPEPLKQNLFSPRFPFRLLVAGTSESGKTSMVVNLLLGNKYSRLYPWIFGEKCKYKIPKNIDYGERYIPCNDLIIVAKHQDEDLWETVRWFYEFIASDKRAPWFEPVTFSMIGPEELPDISAIKKTGRRIVMVFDDLAGEPIAIQQKIEEFFRSGRHSNISPIYIAQHYFETSMKIRANLTHISLHHGGGGSLDNIKRILRSKYDNYESLARKIDSVTKKYFVIIDLKKPYDDPMSIRLRWDKPLSGYNKQEKMPIQDLYKNKVDVA